MHSHIQPALLTERLLIFLALAPAALRPVDTLHAPPVHRGAYVISPSLISQEARNAAKLGKASIEDRDNLLAAVRRTAGTKLEPFIMTVTDGGMVDLAQNMLRSLDAVPADVPKLVVGMTHGVCGSFSKFKSTTCVEMFAQDTNQSDEMAQWGSREYFHVVFRKHTIISIVAASGLCNEVILTDPDIVFLDSPVEHFRSISKTNDVVFSINNYLEPFALNVEDIGEVYETQGMELIRQGPKDRHVDINTGLFWFRSSATITKLMYRAQEIMKEQEHKHGHYQQYSMVRAISEMPEAQIGVAPSGMFVNGNVFWGHRSLLNYSGVVSVHANWMQSVFKRPCLWAAGLWVDPEEKVPQRLDFRNSTDTALTAEAGHVSNCSRLSEEIHGAQELTEEDGLA